MASRYSVNLVRSVAGRAPPRREASWVTESRILFCSRVRAARSFGSVLLVSENSRSKTSLGLFCVGRGVLGPVQLRVLVYGHAYPVSQLPAVSPDSIANSSDASWVCLPTSCARIWSTDMPASSHVSLVGGEISVKKRVLALACAPPGRPGVGIQFKPLSTWKCSRNGSRALSV